MLVSLLLIGSSIASLSEYGGAGAKCRCEVRAFECEPGANWSHSILRSLMPFRFGDGKGVSSCFLVNETEEFIWKNFQRKIILYMGLFHFLKSETKYMMVDKVCM